VQAREKTFDKNTSPGVCGTGDSSDQSSVVTPTSFGGTIKAVFPQCSFNLPICTMNSQKLALKKGKEAVNSQVSSLLVEKFAWS
jgi:hypothetical protein